MTPGIDRSALANGVITIVVIGVPLGLFAAWMGRRGETGIALTANLGVLAVFVIGAGSAAWAQRKQTPIAHGLITALLAQLIISTISVVISITRGHTVNWFGQFILLTLALGCGLLGGVVGGRLRSQGHLPSSQRQASRSTGHAHDTAEADSATDA